MANNISNFFAGIGIDVNFKELDSFISKVDTLERKLKGLSEIKPIKLPTTSGTSGSPKSSSEKADIKRRMDALLEARKQAYKSHKAEMKRRMDIILADRAKFARDAKARKANENSQASEGAKKGGEWKPYKHDNHVKALVTNKKALATSEKNQNSRRMDSLLNERKMMSRSAQNEAKMRMQGLLDARKEKGKQHKSELQRRMDVVLANRKEAGKRYKAEMQRRMDAVLSDRKEAGKKYKAEIMRRMQVLLDERKSHSRNGRSDRDSGGYLKRDMDAHDRASIEDRRRELKKIAKLERERIANNKKITGAIKRQRSGLRGINSSLASLVASYVSVFAIIGQLRNIKEMGKTMEGVTISYELMFGEDAGKAIMNDLREFSHTMGVNAVATLKNARSFLSAAEATMGKDGAVDAFKSLNIIAKVSGSSQDELSRAMVGFSQLQTGEYAQSQELRTQMAENIPALVKFLGKDFFPDLSEEESIKAFKKGMKDNSLSVQKINNAMIKSANELQKSPAFTKMINNMDSSEQRMKSAVQDTYDTIAKGSVGLGGAMAGMASLFQGIESILVDLKPQFTQFGDWLGESISDISILLLEAALYFKNNTGEVVGYFKKFIIALLAKWAFTVGATIAKSYIQIKAFIGLITATRAATRALAGLGVTGAVSGAGKKGIISRILGGGAGFASLLGSAFMAILNLPVVGVAVAGALSYGLTKWLLSFTEDDNGLNIANHLGSWVHKFLHEGGAKNMFTKWKDNIFNGIKNWLDSINPFTDTPSANPINAITGEIEKRNTNPMSDIDTRVGELLIGNQLNASMFRGVNNAFKGNFGNTSSTRRPVNVPPVTINVEGVSNPQEVATIVHNEVGKIIAQAVDE